LFSWHPAPAGNSEAASNRVVRVTTHFQINLAFVRSCSERRQATRWQHGQPWFYL